MNLDNCGLGYHGGLADSCIQLEADRSLAGIARYTLKESQTQTHKSAQFLSTTDNNSDMTGASKNNGLA